MITVFTPTYNRMDKLSKLYESLVKQTNKNFTWLIVDDGSEDNTDKLIETLKLEKKLNIIYYKQENMGKHIAHNKGVELCDTELFFCVDSDDYLTENAIEFILNNIFNMTGCIGMVALKGYSENKVMGNSMPSGISKSTLSDLYNIYGKKGETALIFKTKYLKKNYFPQFKGEKFLSEEILYNKLDNIAPLYVANKIIYVMEYLEDGLTKNYINAWKNSPLGVLELLRSRYDKVKLLKGFNKIYRSIRVVLIFNAFCIEKKIDILQNTPNKFLSISLKIPSYFVSLIKFK